ncbi:ELM1/GtrOC1 family putative glycosyltransferase [Microbulbifer guangxiensis]|uniref:ELM1/GtrOC1 family putative glycosyltransferase n=1 Tax=Microbulbifer guangxiensis TaxID=2904249 RepID=UPI001F2D7C08|nr:ELM1/GtrOC1 family putative glycosyltransferase [Microbulbifer guangxiensis]
MRLTVWRFLDGNRAHEKQTAALVSGLRTCGREVECHDIPATRPGKLLLRGLDRQLDALPQPDFILGAGHRSHWSVLFARRYYGGRSVVVMRPSLPLHWFDFAIIPEHDRPPPLESVILSQGALTEPLPRGQRRPGKGLILLGGPSKHFNWDASAVHGSLQRLLSEPLDWTLSDSRRTPAGSLEGLPAGSATICDWRECPPGWLAGQLAESEQVWVTGDSVSMIFEALQSEARVGVITLPSRRRANKVRAAVQRLVDQQRLTDRVEDVAVPVGPPRDPLAQEVLCARALLRRSGHLAD